MSNPLFLLVGAASVAATASGHTIEGAIILAAMIVKIDK